MSDMIAEIGDGGWRRRGGHLDLRQSKRTWWPRQYRNPRPLAKDVHHCSDTPCCLETTGRLSPLQRSSRIAKMRSEAPPVYARSVVRSALYGCPAIRGASGSMPVGAGERVARASFGARKRSLLSVALQRLSLWLIGGRQHGRGKLRSRTEIRGCNPRAIRSK